MRALIQRVSSAEVSVNQELIGKISRGVLILLGITKNDTKKDVEFLVNKILNLRIFSEKEHFFEKSLLDNRGEILIISQFTLYGDCAKGRRPDFVQAASGETAKPLYNYFIKQCELSGLKIEKGEFGANMQINLTNDGPVTLMLETS